LGIVLYVKNLRAANTTVFMYIKPFSECSVLNLIPAVARNLIPAVASITSQVARIRYLKWQWYYCIDLADLL